MLADVLNAPVPELSVRDDIDAGKDFVDAGALEEMDGQLDNLL